MKEASLERWRSRIARAVALIDGRLDDPPSLQELADAACISPFHLHRVWRALVGETVAQTVRRLRLEASEYMLGQGGSITETAMAVGFSTPQSYARAFRQRTGTSPSAHRVGHMAVREPNSGRPHVGLEQRGELLVVALRREGKSYEDLNATFGEIWRWAERRGLLGRLSGIYGIPLDDPASVSTGPLRYDACLALGEIADIPLPLRNLALPDSEYARLRHIGAYDRLDEAMQYLIGEWLPRSGREAMDFPAVHHFLNDPDETPADELVTDILLPLRPEG